jgi:hypothetical protein
MQSSAGSEITPRHIVRFFTRMQHLYGHKWTSAYGLAMKGEELTASAKQWLYDLRAYSSDQVAAGLVRMEQRGQDWPPGPSEFRRLCDGIPTIDEVLDRDNHYGLVCEAIRQRLDWYNLDGMSSTQMREAADRQVRAAVTSLAASGAIRKLSAQAALTDRRAPDAIDAHDE